MLEATSREKNRIIVFIEGYSPTEAERALAEKHGTSVFMTTQVPTRVVAHKLAVAVEGVIIPEGYTTKLEEAPKAPAPPKTNPAAKSTAAAGLPALGSLGLRPEGA